MKLKYMLIVGNRIEVVLTVAYNTQNCWSFRLCPLFGILKTRKHNVSESGSVSLSMRWEEDTCNVRSLRKSYIQSPDLVRCIYSTNVVGKDLDTFALRVVSVNGIYAHNCQ
jgi:hypothetical protein